MKTAHSFESLVNYHVRPRESRGKLERRRGTIATTWLNVCVSKKQNISRGGGVSFAGAMSSLEKNIEQLQIDIIFWRRRF